jgi:ornithine cyclodeaminase/alanine dehydrogenase-like protein (mu-crystallin family)
MADLVAALERAFAAGPGDSRALGLDAPRGAFHVKAATLAAPAEAGGESRLVFVAKVNANFPGNPAAGLPTIQGLAALFDARDGTLLALLDSPELTARRTGAATAVAARRLARAGARSLLFCGCGRQAPAQLEALLAVLAIERLTVCDLDAARAERFAGEAALRYGLAVAVARLPTATSRDHDLIVTCTPARGPILGPADVAPGTFLAAVGADHPTKQEIDPALLAAVRLVVDSRVSAAACGELHHALEAGYSDLGERAAELGEVVRGERPGRVDDDEITLFDSTGIALEDAAAALVAYERAQASGAPVCDFGS